MAAHSKDPVLDMYIFETTQNISQLEATILSTEKMGTCPLDIINEIFRIMHTIKGSSAMMLFNEMASLAHTVEDLFYYLRENKCEFNCSDLADMILESVDFMKTELAKIQEGRIPDGNSLILAEKINQYLQRIKKPHSEENGEQRPATEDKERYYISSANVHSQDKINTFRAVIKFDEGCEMENIRAYAIIHHAQEIAEEVYYLPENILENEDTASIIQASGFTVYLKTYKSYDEIHDFFMQTIFLRELELIELQNDDELHQFTTPKNLKTIESPIRVPKLQVQETNEIVEKEGSAVSANQGMISVNVMKLDKLMDIMGEMVIAEAMVTQHPEVKNLQLDSFQKAARQLHKITGELQDMVMSIRMVPLAGTFQKQHRIVRDMSKKLEKDVRLKINGEETEVDKNLLERISDPLMHLIRNAIDHGIEPSDDRIMKGKPAYGTVTLTAKNSGSDVLILVSDDGKGLNKQKILEKAIANDLITKDQNELTENEIYNLILLPGFSTKDSISEFSGRGVGMDVVTKNLEAIGGMVSVDSTEGFGTTITLKIPLTLAIIDGMTIGVGHARYTIPTIAIKESFRPTEKDIIQDPDGNEMIMVRGACYPVLRLHEHFDIYTDVKQITKGILIMVEQDHHSLCVFADELLGQQQVVVKPLPNYIRNTKKIKGLSGCTLLGDGSISLILDIGGLMQRERTMHAGKES